MLVPLPGRGTVRSPLREKPVSYLLQMFDRLALRLGRRIVEVLGKHGDSYNILEVAAIKASFESAAYYEKQMLGARLFKTDLELLSHAVRSTPDGLMLEFGVASGRTINYIASQTNRPIYGFDSFEGLPENWRSGFEQGRFKTLSPHVPVNVHLLRGLFADTLPSFLQEHGGPVGFIHIDCDLYSSTKFVLESLSNRIAAGCVIVFDEYFNYPGWQEHEYKAFQEFSLARNMEYRYIGLVPSRQQVCVLVDRVGA